MLSIEPTLKGFYLRHVNGKNEEVTNNLNLCFYYGQLKEKVICDTLSEYRSAIKQKLTEGFKIYGCNSELNCFIHSNYLQYDHKLTNYNIINLDIETSYDYDKGYGTITDPHQSILTICYQINGKKPVILTTKKVDFNIDYKIICYQSENEMLKSFFDVFRKENVHIITGWNIKFYDIPYLISRSMRLQVDHLVISPLRKVSKMIDNELNEPYYTIAGIHTLDYCQLYKKFNYLNEVYIKLNTVAKKELDSKKVEYLDKYANLKDLYEKNYKLFLEYNAKDVELVTELDQKLNFLSLSIQIQNFCLNPNLENIFSTLSNSIHLHIKYFKMKNNYFPEYVTKDKITELRVQNENYGSIIGGYVLKPKPNVYKNIAILDFTSLYPSIIRTFNIGIDSYMGLVSDMEITRPLYVKYKSKDYSKYRDKFFKLFFEKLKNVNIKPNYKHNLTANGVIYQSDDISSLSLMMSDLFEQRLKTRTKMREYDKKSDEYKTLNLEQMAYKILLNSQFGAIGNKYYIYGSYEVAESITSTGQFLIQSVIERLKTLGYNVIYTDTDSLFISISENDDITKQEIENKIYNEILPHIRECVKDTIKNKLHTKNENVLNMSLENVFKKGIFWSTKKRYYLKNFNDEVKAKGISSIKSDLSESYKDIFNTCIEMRLEGKEPKHIYEHLNQIKEKKKKDMISFSLRTQLKYNIKKYVANAYDLLETLKKSHKKVYDLLNVPDDLTSEQVEDLIKMFKEITKENDKKYVQKAYRMLCSEIIQGTPAHFKGAHVWNKLIKEKELEQKYEYITGGISVARLPLKDINLEWISIPVQYEKNFSWDIIDIESIDYDKLFETNVITKIKNEVF